MTVASEFALYVPHVYHVLNHTCHEEKKIFTISDVLTFSATTMKLPHLRQDFITDFSFLGSVILYAWVISYIFKVLYIL